MRLLQFFGRDGARHVGVIRDDGEDLHSVDGAVSVRDLALEAHRNGRSLRETVEARGLGEILDYDELVRERRLLVPLDHPEPSRMVIAITGLTHLGSAKSRDEMHAKLASDDLSDSMKMFKMGVEGGKPDAGSIGVQPEWAYKGDGSWVVAPEQPIELPAYAEDGGEEAEIAGLYVIGDRGEVLRVGFVLGNEYSDHVMERRNYLYLAHSKLRPCSYGPELLVGELPSHVAGTSKILRDGREIWSQEFLSGEANMCHSIANLEHHHFKYGRFRRPGDVHVYFFGASTLSCSDGIQATAGDIFEISSPLFGKPLRNPVVAGTARDRIAVETL